jgi:leader peptidase (prepilin peptidase)/N-methyltransferase
MMEQYTLVNAHFPWFFPLFATLLGACVGSFLNVCIYRIPEERSVVFPGSHCACGAPIRWFHNIPVLSWFALGGKARCCGRRFSVRYPLVEAFTAGVFLLSWVFFKDDGTGKAIGGMVFACLLICATGIDLDHMIIPDRFTIGGFAAGLAIAFVGPSLHGFVDGPYVLDMLRGFATALIGGLVGSALVLWIGLFAEAVLRREAMGFGDVKFLGAIGAFCGWQGAVFAVFGGAVIGTAGVLLYLPFRALSRGSKPTPDPQPAGDDDAAPRDQAQGEEEGESGDEEDGGDTLVGRHIPFGPMLALAGLLYFLFLSGPVDNYFAEVAWMLFSTP